MENPIAQVGLMAVFFGVFALIPTLWLLVGLKTYGTGDYHQP